MKRITLLIVIISCLTTVNAQFSYDKSKLENIRWTPNPEKVTGLENHIIDLTGDWKFSSTPENDYFKKEQHTREWLDISVPGEWVMQGFEVGQGKYAGYFRTFEISNAWKGFRVKLKCEAIYSECEIWINGKYLGSHLGGFTAFEFDVTDLINKGKNSIAIGVRSESLADTLSSASKYAVHPLGGISRPIYLMALPEVNLASFHVNTTFDEHFKDAELKAEIILANESLKKEDVGLNFSLTDSKGAVISFEGADKYKLTPDKSEKERFSASFKVSNPLKWDCEHPNLYYLKCTVIVDGKELKTVTRRFGFRQVEVKENQVLVNNRVIKLKGVCRHEVHPLRGRSLNANQWYEDVKLFKEGNVNYIRTSHYPPNEKLLEACDELGMFVEVEAPFCWASKKPITDENYFEAILQPTMEMVERDKSHPSIIHWSLANESHDFKELYQISADLVREADPSRPRIFSQWNENSDSGYLELGNFHYPGLTGPAKFSNNKRPVIFDEFCHLNAYNRFELMTDPGLRDIWGVALKEMWEAMYKTPAILGGALWAGIDDSFFLPGGENVGYGTWGPVDGWRRKKPEFWHMKKVFSPVKIELVDGNNNEELTLNIENRYIFTNLKECKIVWKNNGKTGSLSPDIKPGETKEVILPITNSQLNILTIDVFKEEAVPADSYVFDFALPEIAFGVPNKSVFKTGQTSEKFTAESERIKVEITNRKLVISNSNGNRIIEDWPALMLIPLKAEGAGIQMTKDTPEFEIFSPEARNRRIESIDINSVESEISIVLTDTYEQASGSMEIKITAGGEIKLTYDFFIREDLNLRQWGVTFALSQRFNELDWKRKGLWTVYPENHIGRLNGTALLFNESEMCGLAGPRSKPDWSWNTDQNTYGSNDFRSTKRNILRASLRGDKGEGINLASNGLQHIRCWSKNGNTHMLVADYDNLGAERFLANRHGQKWNKPLIKGDRIGGTVSITIE